MRLCGERGSGLTHDQAARPNAEREVTMPEQPTDPKPEPDLAEDIPTADWEEEALDAAWEKLFPGCTGPIPEPKKPKEEGDAAAP